VFTTRAADVQVPLDADSPAPAGALALAEAARRFGWQTERAELPLAAARPAATYAAVRAAHGVRERDAGQLLAAVRAGAGLVVDVRPAGDPLSDSLGLRLVTRGAWTLDNRRTAARLGVAAAIGRPGCAPRVVDARAGTDAADFVLADSGAAAEGAPGRRLFVDAWRRADGGDVDPPAPRPARPGAAGRGTRPDARTAAAPPATGVAWSPVLVGFPLGRGRVVAVADASLLTNGALRTCWAAAGPAALRALEWVAPAQPAGARGRGALVFLQGRRAAGAEPGGASPLRATWRALTEVPAGRAVAQALGAALVLLAALGARPVPPLPAGRAERRSPREHVGALARAYHEARATRLVARRLARGLRRRYGGAGRAAAGPAADEAAFLATLPARLPPALRDGAARDAAALAAATREPVAPSALAEVGAAAARLDAALDTARRGGASPGTAGADTPR
jgi:hypothetical protein